MKKLLIVFALFLSINSFAQVNSAQTVSVWQAKEYSKDISLFRAKYFLFNRVLGVSEDIKTFELIPLAASSSGELTTLFYKSEDFKKEGLILGFYGNYWNDAGVIYQGYSFKNLTKEEAIEFMDKISTSIGDNSKFMGKNSDNNNIYFKYKDIDVLVYYSGTGAIIRLFWNGFDSTWDGLAFDRSKRRFEKKLK
ncbi:MAG: hypothetical protein LBE34_12860 [Flavobacteriaceae bacterium]|jgi:hypothetical protein|nr:hypothetical protein [Flavobacteriaceae bacterium]